MSADRHDTNDAAAIRVGAVIIGRNEGERLERCLESVLESMTRVVYVDSGSTDDSVAMARERGVEVVELDLAQPFTAARARNEGFQRLIELYGTTDLEHVQFLDGDCTLDPGWIDVALAALDDDGELGVVCGRRRERFPDASRYNKLCDLEWDTPVGNARACGGDALFRRRAFEEVDGFRASIIAGEEPELCVRLLLAGWRIERLDAEMTMHDAAMTHASQWWRRNERAGHAYAEGCHRHGRGPTRHAAREVRSIVVWGAALPTLAFATAWPTGGLSIGLLVLYGVLWLRIRRYARRRNFAAADASLYAWSCVLGKFPQLRGLLRYHGRRLRGTTPTLIEYKTEAKR